MSNVPARDPATLSDADFRALLAERIPDLAAKLVRLEVLETEFAAQLEREKLAALKELAYGASHEINNPLANISTRAQALLRDETDPERRRKLATIAAQAFRANEMIADMMLFAKPPKLVRSAVDVAKLVDKVIRELTPDAKNQGTIVERSGQSDALVVSLDETQIGVAVKAVIQNALEALGAGGRVDVVISPLISGENIDAPGVEIAVSDTGPGISPEVRRHLFDPFYSGREAGRGLGFGLAKCWRIVTDHGGKIEVESEMGRGSRFKIVLPGATV